MDMACAVSYIFTNVYNLNIVCRIKNGEDIGLALNHNQEYLQKKVVVYIH